MYSLSLSTEDSKGCIGALKERFAQANSWKGKSTPLTWEVGRLTLKHAAERVPSLRTLQKVKEDVAWLIMSLKQDQVSF